MSDFREIDITLIDDPEIATRAEIDDQALAELASDIAKNGLYYPIIVKPVGDRFEAVDGHRRLLACRSIPLGKVMCQVLGAGAPPPEEVKLKTNMLRVQNNDAELAVYIGELADKQGYNMDQLRQITGMSESWINDRYALLRGDPEVLNALGRGEINFSHAQVLNACKDEYLRRQGLHFVLADGLPATRLKEWIHRNLAMQQQGVTAPAAADPGNGEAVTVSSGIVCVWCGGTHMPHMMENFWIHKWEWEIVLQIRAGYFQQGKE